MDEHDLVRERLVSRRDVLIEHYHAAIERADAKLDAREPEDGTNAAEHWAARVLAFLADESDELHEVLAAIERLDRGDYGRCRTCGGPLDASALAELPAAVLCVDCAITKVMPAITGGARHA
jgi:DnaK suppressor protein